MNKLQERAVKKAACASAIYIARNMPGKKNNQYQDSRSTPATIRTQFQRTLALIVVHCRYEALRTAEEKGLTRRNRREIK